MPRELIQPYDRALTAWVRRPNGSYGETGYRGGALRPAALPTVAIDFDAVIAPLRRAPRA